MPRLGILAQGGHFDFAPAVGTAETACVSKSLLAIAGIGVAGCCMLSWMMNHLVAQRREPASANLERALAATFADRLEGPPTVHEEYEGTRRRFLVSGRGKAGDLHALAADVGRELWQRLGRGTAPPDEVLVRLRRADGPELTLVVVPPPAKAR